MVIMFDMILCNLSYFRFKRNSLNSCFLVGYLESMNSLTRPQILARLCSSNQYRGIRKQRTGVIATILR